MGQVSSKPQKICKTFQMEYEDRMTKTFGESPYMITSAPTGESQWFPGYAGEKCAIFEEFGGNGFNVLFVKALVDGKIPV